jgi:hypothetical protein
MKNRFAEVVGLLYSMRGNPAAMRRSIDAVLNASRPNKPAAPRPFSSAMRRWGAGDVVVNVDKPTGEIANRAGVDEPPTDAQKEAGNYKKNHSTWNGLGITIENPKGSERSGTDKNGVRWSVTMPAAYGYVKRTKDTTGEQVDVYLGDDPESNKVWVVHQFHLEPRRFDEWKCLLGFPDKATAIATYKAGFSDGKGADRIGEVTEMTVDEFKAWLPTAHQSESLQNTLADMDALLNGRGKPCGNSHIQSGDVCHVGEWATDNAHEKWMDVADGLDERKGRSVASKWLAAQPDNSVSLENEKARRLWHATREAEDGIRALTGGDWETKNRHGSKAAQLAADAIRPLAPIKAKAVFRGLCLRSEAVFNKLSKLKPGQVLKPKRPLESFSTKESIANKFAIDGGNRRNSKWGAVVIVENPTVFKTVGRYGQHGEDEVIANEPKLRVKRVVRRKGMFAGVDQERVYIYASDH